MSDVDSSNIPARCGLAGAGVRRASPDEAAAIWGELLRGAWSIVDRFDDASGRRFLLVLRAGAPPVRAWERLSDRERAIVAAVAAGRGNRTIAAELGVSTSTVAGHLRAARRKLGGIRRVDLVREWLAAARPSDERR